MFTGSGWGVGEQISSYTDGTLASIRKKLVEISGRYDLVVDAEAGDWSDNGADYFLRSASRWLDRKFPYNKQYAWVYKTLESGNMLVTFDNARYVKSVRICQDGELYYVPQIAYHKRFEQFDTESSDTNNRVWSPAYIEVADGEIEADYEESGPFGVKGTEELVFAPESYPLSGILISPPPTTDIVVQVLGSWYSKFLEHDTDVNYWTKEHPELIVRAAMMQLAVDTNRNAQERAEFEESLTSDLWEIYRDFISEESGEHPQYAVMRG